MQRIYPLLICLSLAGIQAPAQTADEKAVRKILEDQIFYWNKGDLDNFVKGYWNNDSVMFIGSRGVIYGYQNTLQRYKTTYSDTAQMGKLAFTILYLNRLSPEYYFVTGKWVLKRTVGDAGGHFTLLFRKIRGEWKIIADHSS